MANHSLTQMLEAKYVILLLM